MRSRAKGRPATPAELEHQGNKGALVSSSVTRAAPKSSSQTIWRQKRSCKQPLTSHLGNVLSAIQVSARVQVSKRDGLNKEWRTRVLYTKLSLTVGSSPTAFLRMQKCQAWDDQNLWYRRRLLRQSVCSVCSCPSQHRSATEPRPVHTHRCLPSVSVVVRTSPESARHRFKQVCVCVCVCVCVRARQRFKQVCVCAWHRFKQVCVCDGFSFPTERNEIPKKALRLSLFPASTAEGQNPVGWFEENKLRTL